MALTVFICSAGVPVPSLVLYPLRKAGSLGSQGSLPCVSRVNGRRHGTPRNKQSCPNTGGLCPVAPCRLPAAPLQCLGAAGCMGKAGSWLGRTEQGGWNRNIRLQVLCGNDDILSRVSHNCISVLGTACFSLD